MQTTLSPPRKKKNQSVMSIGRKGFILEKKPFKQNFHWGHVKFCAAVIAILGLTPYNK